MWIELGIFIAIAGIVWALNVRSIRQGFCEKITSEIYMHTGLGLFFTLLPLELFFGHANLWPRLDIQLLTIIGFGLYIPATIFVVGSFVAFHHKGKTEAGDLTATTTFVDTGVFAIVRQPMTLGMAFFSIALIFLSQSLIILIPSMIAFGCFYMSAQTEAPHNIAKFGEAYREYMARVPMWNFIKGLRRRPI